jgi:hypothetical protein
MQFRQSDILHLPDSLSGHSEFLSNFFESFRFAVVQPVSLEDDRALAVVQHLQKLAKFVAHVLVSEQFERRLRISSPMISPNSVESSSLIGASREAGPNLNRLQLRKFPARDTDLFGQFFIGRFTTQLSFCGL